MRHRCSCGARLQWERRDTLRGPRWFALCASAACGRWTRCLADGDEPEDGLAGFLLDGPVHQSEERPWVRFFAHVQDMGLAWAPQREACVDCGDHLVMRLDLGYGHQPYRATLCLYCGAVEVYLLVQAHPTALRLDGNAWAGSTVTLRALREAVRRASHAAQGDSWDWPHEL